MLFEILQNYFALSGVQKITVAAIPIIFAITMREAAYAYAARYFGDMTASEIGRLSFNPIKHIDLVGTLIAPALSIFFGGILFGWAKPLAVDFNRMRNPKQDMCWVAAAGLISNLIMAILWLLVVKFAMQTELSYSEPMAYMGAVGVMINVVLMVLNLLPLPPLDGGRIAVSLLPNQYAFQLAKLEPYGFIILIVLMMTKVLGVILNPMIVFIMSAISAAIL